MPEDSTQKKAAMPGTAAAAAAFDRELFRDALYTRSLNVQTSARAAIIPTGEDIVTPRALTDRCVPLSVFLFGLSGAPAV